MKLKMITVIHLKGNIQILEGLWVYIGKDFVKKGEKKFIKIIESITKTKLSKDEIKCYLDDGYFDDIHGNEVALVWPIVNEK